MTLSRTLTLVLILTAFAWATQMFNRPENIIAHRSFGQFPLTLGDWQGTRNTLDKRVHAILGVEDYILGNYRNARGETVNLYVGFYRSQREGDLIHSPRNCIPGAGWHIVNADRINISFTPHGPAVPLARLLIQKGDEKQMVLYWFQSRGRIIASEYMQKIWLVLDAIVKQRTDGSFVRLIASVTDNENTTLEILKAFARDVKPHLNAYIP